MNNEERRFERVEKIAFGKLGELGATHTARHTEEKVRVLTGEYTNEKLTNGYLRSIFIFHETVRTWLADFIGLFLLDIIRYLVGFIADHFWFGYLR